MLWFKKKKIQEQRICDKEVSTLIAVEQHKAKTQKVVKNVTKNTLQFNKTLRNNHIMFKIHSATTGRGH